MPTDPTIIPSENNIIQSALGPITPASLTEIITLFNQENDSTSSRSSILKKLNFSGFSLFKHRMLATDQVRLVQRNGAAELAGHSGHFQRRIKIWSLWKPWTWFRVFRDDSSTIGIYSIEQIINRAHIGYGDRHLVVVNSTDYAKVTLDGKTVLLDEGAHVFKTNNFSYAAKVAKSTSYIEHGDLLILMPPPNTVAVYNIGSKQFTFPDNSASNSRNKEENQAGIIEKDEGLEIRNPNAKFVTFLDTNLINKNYPTEKEQFTYYTKDSVQVGVKLFVAYRIIDPKLAIEKLGPTGIDKHIEHVTHVDMARAGQETSLQGLQSSSDLKIDATAGTSESANDNPPAYHQIYLSTWQESVKKQLEKDLKEYGIQLVRLNIEEINILNKDVENEMGKQAVAVAKANADLAAIEMQKIVAFKNAQIASEVAQFQAQQTAATNLIEAENSKKVAELNKEATGINAKAQAEALQLLGDKLAANPDLLKYQITKANCEAIERTHIHTLFFADGKNSSLFNNQGSLLPNIEGTNLLTNSK
jgi:regulator of protease activity HflC (stomatin/prohibitin superfamily)